MGRTLRVGFAMGGGNSLGTFNGAAISQALKLLLLRGIDRDGEPYERVEVDVFSGASAGSMSLALMLRSLVYPDPNRRKKAKASLIAEFGEEFTRRSRAVQKAILAAQVLQDIQEEVWVREINIDKLLGLSSPGAQRRIRFSAGILDRGAVDELANRYLTFPELRVEDRTEGSGVAVPLSKRQILADRVLFASSIANLSPILADARREFPIDDLGLLGLSDGMTSSVHSELRVFDLHFRPVKPESLADPDAFPKRWCRYHAGPAVRDTDGTGRGIGSLFGSRGWSKIAATSVASGAIPFAFEPVPLERRSYEFGETEDGDTSSWPKELKGKDRFVFTYVDGGTFNNEPIREAFRLASFIDAQAPEDDYERLVLFVDPHVVVPKSKLGLPHHDRWMMDRPNRLLGPVGKAEVRRRTSLDRIIPLTGTLLTALTNESRVVEADKVFQTRKQFDVRNLIRNELNEALAKTPDLSSLESLAENLKGLLDSQRAGVLIPAGALTLEGELRRVIVEEGGPDQSLSSLGTKSQEEIRAFATHPPSAPEEDRGLWLRALTFVAVDRVMDLDGKMEKSQLVAISPATDPTDPGKLEDLPGRLASGFGGFMSELAGEHEVKVARYCAQLFLQAAGRVRKRGMPDRPDFSRHRGRYLKEVKKGLEAAENRLVDLIADSHVDVLGSLPAGVLRHFLKGKMVRLARRKKAAPTHELRIQVPNGRYEFDGRGLRDGDQKPKRIGGEHFLITFAAFSSNNDKPWTGPNVVGKKQALKVDKDRKGVHTDKEFCRVLLPTKTQLKTARHLPNPVWVARIRKTDEGRRIGSDRWRLSDQVVGLEESLLGKPRTDG